MFLKDRIDSEQIKKAFAFLESSGHLDPALYCAFDQKGNWYGLPSMCIEEQKKMVSRLVQLKLPTELVAYTNALGQRVLRTSFISEDGDKKNRHYRNRGGVSVGLEDYHVVMGNIQTSGKELVLPHLKSVYGSITPQESRVSLPSLESVGLDINVRAADAIEMANIESIGGGFFGEELLAADFPKLSYVGGDLDLRNSRGVNIPSLRFVGGYLQIWEAPRLDLGSLKEVGGTCWVASPKIYLPNLCKVGGDFLTGELVEVTLIRGVGKLSIGGQAHVDLVHDKRVLQTLTRSFRDEDLSRWLLDNALVFRHPDFRKELENRVLKKLKKGELELVP